MRIPRRLPNYPWNDNEPIYFGTDNDTEVYFDGTYLRFDGSASEILFQLTGAGYSKIFGGVTTGDDLYIYANTVDAYPFITMLGTGGIYIRLPATGGLWLYDAATISLKMSYATPDFTIECPIDAKNIFLKTTGAGLIKFGTYTAGAALASIGYIDILDAGGNARKIMIQA